ncbi:DUF2924 domain-containing protein [Teredinibacter sp. KSP-S5-2]|uniref:DUF2924 domain-containing protein n=1 Tax=Teredinibacter sp. KSP-S5-2 TaxID=3034506 RepID=UPI0029344D73|nr:DUF2924 domain-containing protein [Teredinibacter sp. KSP-S5-2]WNO10508.1 DUF2924 domain-containing protein [Teredinibacter sp. KSP-S5-2]
MPDVVAKVAALQTMSSYELQELWFELYGHDVSTSRKEYLIPRLAYRIQELAYGGLSEAAQKILREKLDDSVQDPTSKKSQVTIPVVGTRITREYKGVEHQVTVTREGFEYQGQTHGSLSKIAKAITGTHISGPAFFGLTEKKAKAKRKTSNAR